MRIEWDYTDVADGYRHRPDYAPQTLPWLAEVCPLRSGQRVCDVGAGTGHLTRLLLAQGLQVDAVEPNRAMRQVGQELTACNAQVHWYSGVAEQTGRPHNHYPLVAFGSSFNVVNRTLAWAEARRIARPGGCFAALWNHRDLNDPLQAQIERCIHDHLPTYRYGKRRHPLHQAMQKSALFKRIEHTTLPFQVQQKPAEVLAAWGTHLTLKRQAGQGFQAILDGIAEILMGTGESRITVPYETRVWCGQFKP